MGGDRDHVAFLHTDREMLQVIYLLPSSDSIHKVDVKKKRGLFISFKEPQSALTGLFI